mgnify:FL=1
MFRSRRIVARLLPAVLAGVVVHFLASASSAGEIAKYETRRLVLHTDVKPATARMLVQAFDAAWKTWVAEFGLPPDDRDGRPLRIIGCVMIDPDDFSAAGLLPRSIEKFLEGDHPGKHQRHRFWMNDQKGDYYRRHLMIHEATHCFMTARGGPMLPVWYLEGTAELLATHVVDPRTGRYRFGVMPTDVGQLPGWGRLGMLRRDVRRGRLPRFELLSQLWTTEHKKIETYAWSWAYCRFLASHPTYRVGFKELGRHLGDGKFDAAFERAFGPRSDVLQFEWQLAARDMVPGFDFQRSAIRFVRSERLPVEGARVMVTADRGWQSTGVRVEKGVSLKVAAGGRFTLAREPKPWISTARGISFRYHARLPLGRLVGVVQPERVTSDKPPRVVSLGDRGQLVPATSGTLFLRLNDFLSELADNTGSVMVTITGDGR